tara:strand:- start:1766 stop:2269 length:504 start_codon:yes stop_codon:yes gene_type:complete
MLTQNRLKELFSYNPLTGVFTRKVKLSYKSKIGEVVGCLTKAGYLTTQVNGKSYRLHRLAYFYMTGDWPNITDHINGVKTDNRWTNLRSCTQQQNTFNQKISSNNTSGFKGVSWVSKRKKWYVTVGGHKPNPHVGAFDSLEEAAIVAKRVQAEVHGVYACSGQKSIC